MSQIKKKITLVSIALIAILGVIAYGNSLDGKFILDDSHNVEDNPLIRSWSNLPKVFNINIRMDTGEKRRFYRPLQSVTYMIDYSLWGLNVRGYHVVNVLLHILVVLAIYWLINILFRDKLLSLLTSILFIVHPIHTETVAYISDRSELLVALFVLLCFIFYIKQFNSKRISIYILMLVSFVLALASKENSLILPALLLLYHYTFKKKIKLNAFIPLLLIVLVYIVLRLEGLKSTASKISSATTVFQRIPGFFVAITNYIRVLLLPFNLHMGYGKKVFNFTHPQAIAGIILTILLLLYAIKVKKSKGVVFFSIAWFFLALLPVSNLYPIAFYMADHFLYLPSIGFFLLLATGLSYLCKIKKLRVFGIIFILSLLTFYSCLTIRQNEYWRDPLAFYQRTLSYDPDSAWVLNNLGNAYNDAGDKEEAIELYNKAIENDPAHIEAYNNLADLYYELDRKEEAVELYKKAIEIEPDDVEAYNNLGSAYYSMGKAEEAIELYKKAIEIAPDNAEAYNNLGATYYDMGKLKEAIELYKKAIEKNPYYVGAYSNLGVIYYGRGNKEEAIALYRKAIKIDPKIVEAYNNLANAYNDAGNKKEAIELHKKAIEINPDYQDSYYNLGVVYESMGKDQEAIELYQKAIEIDPNYAKAYNNLGSLYYQRGSEDEAVELYKKAIEADPDYARAYDNLSVVYFHQKQYKLAIEYSEKAKELGFTNIDLIEALKPYREKN